LESGDSGLNMVMTVESVETLAQLAKIRAVGCNCNEMQGYLFSPPLPGTELRQFFPPRTWDDCAAAAA
jgi:EAL domain-containing protein (putative c-di-GMP-specific phosphodiesterase class I)